MAPIKFEENIKEKLEQRSLQPSADAWQSLEQKLNAAHKKRHKNKFWWFGIAASVIGVLIIIQQFTSFDSTNQVTPTVISESEDNILNNAIESLLIIEETQQVVQEQSEDTPLTQKLNTTSSNKTVHEKHKVKQQSPIKVSVIAKSEDTPSHLQVAKVSKEDVVVSLTNISDASPNDVNEIAASETGVSEIEALLNAATKDIQLSDQNKTINTVSIDANTLLEDVETEMPPSLRGQLFKTIEKNFKTVKTAVATRNE